MYYNLFGGINCLGSFPLWLPINESGFIILRSYLLDKKYIELFSAFSNCIKMN
jgi:hypothetical protein